MRIYIQRYSSVFLLLAFLSGCSYQPITPTCCDVYDVRHHFLVTLKSKNDTDALFTVHEKLYSYGPHLASARLPRGDISVPLEKVFVTRCSVMDENTPECRSEVKYDEKYVMIMHIYSELDTEYTVLAIYPYDAKEQKD